MILEIVLSCFLFFSFNFIGKNILIRTNIKNIFENLVNPILINFLIGLLTFLIFIYPLILYGIINLTSIKVIFILLIIIGIYDFLKIVINYSEYRSKIKSIKLSNISLNKGLFYLILALYFLLSLLPIFDADSTAYHLFIPKYFILNGNFPIHTFNYQTYLLGIGEIFNTFLLVFNLQIFITLTNFIGLLILVSIIFNLSSNNDGKYFLSLLILSCPILLPLINSAKPQLLYTCTLAICYSLIINLFNSNKNFSEKELIKIFCIIVFLSLICYLAKISFAISYFLLTIFFCYFLFVKNLFKKFIYKILIIFFLINCLFLLPIIYWKSLNYNDNIFIFFTNPFPINEIIGIELFFDHIKNYFDKPIINYIFPTTLSDLTNFFGISLFILYYLIFLDYNNKKTYIILTIIFIILITFLNQRAPRFYIEIFFFVIFSLSLISHKMLKSKSFYFFKYLTYLQAIIVILFLSFAIYNFLPSKFNNNYKAKIFSKYAYGYQLYSWTNKIIPKEDSFLTNHRSIYYSNSNPLFLEFSYFMKKNKEIMLNYQLENLNRQNPKYILFWGEDVRSYSYNDINFEKCLKDEIASNSNAGIEVSRNPFNHSDKFYPAKIFSLKDIDLNLCVKLNS